MTENSVEWGHFRGTGTQVAKTSELPDAPPWRQFSRSQKDSLEKQKGENFQIFDNKTLELVNAALYLRRPLLVTGLPGSGKTSLAYAIAFELNLGKVLKWAITSRSTLKDALYRYDAVGRLQDEQALSEIGRYIQLGPLGTALKQSKKNNPRVLLVDEIDKSDLDLANDLLNVFEEGEFEIPELARLDIKKTPKLENVEVRTSDGDSVTIPQGKVECEDFPFVLMTSNGERDFPPAFKRRCLELKLETPNTPEALERILTARFKGRNEEDLLQLAQPYIEDFIEKRKKGDTLANDQFLNVVFMLNHLSSLSEPKRKEMIERLTKSIEK